jgi:hypothetical protein
VSSFIVGDSPSGGVGYQSEAFAGRIVDHRKDAEPAPVARGTDVKSIDQRGFGLTDMASGVPVIATFDLS